LQRETKMQHFDWEGVGLPGTHRAAGLQCEGGVAAADGGVLQVHVAPVLPVTPREESWGVASVTGRETSRVGMGEGIQHPTTVSLSFPFLIFMFLLLQLPLFPLLLLLRPRPRRRAAHAPADD
jgi:hypothetical protein